MTKTITMLLQNDNGVTEEVRFVKLNDRPADRVFKTLVKAMFKELE